MSPWYNREAPAAQSLIRSSITKHHLNTDTKWGFVIIRGTYASQERWEKFLSLIKQDTRESLTENTLTFDEPEDGLDLWEALEWTVLEDEQALDAVDFKVARDRFDAWAKAEIERDTEGMDVTEWMGDVTAVGRFRYLTACQQPRRRFFLWVDEASLSSVVDCDAQNDRGRVGGYFVWVIRSGLSEDQEEEDVKEGEEDSGWGDPDEVNEEGWCATRQKFQAWDLVNVYASILLGNWPDGYLRQDETGVIEIVDF